MVDPLQVVLCHNIIPNLIPKHKHFNGVDVNCHPPCLMYCSWSAKVDSLKGVCQQGGWWWALPPLNVLVKIYHFWPLSQKFDPCCDPYDCQRFYIFFSSDALHKITVTCLSSKNNLIPPLLRSHVTSGLLRDHTSLFETKTDMIFSLKFSLTKPWETKQ